MPGNKKMKHPIVSEKQRGFFGAELARKRAGKKGKTDMSESELSRHLKEYKGTSYVGEAFKKMKKRKKK